MTEKKTYEVWMEGYSITGNKSEEEYIGKVYASSFLEACQLLMGGRLDKDKYGKPTNSSWGRTLYENKK